MRGLGNGNPTLNTKIWSLMFLIIISEMDSIERNNKSLTSLRFAPVSLIKIPSVIKYLTPSKTEVFRGQKTHIHLKDWDASDGF